MITSCTGSHCGEVYQISPIENQKFLNLADEIPEFTNLSLRSTQIENQFNDFGELLTEMLQKNSPKLVDESIQYDIKEIMLNINAGMNQMYTAFSIASLKLPKNNDLANEMVKDLEKIGVAAKAVQKELDSGYTYSQMFWQFVNRHKYGSIPYQTTNIPNTFSKLGKLLGVFVDKYSD